MKVIYIRGKKDVSYSNILWDKKFPVRRGRFPYNHPCASSGPIEAFRSRGYWASCFPEGDGITFEIPDERPDEEVIKDITECFGWEVLGE